MVGVIPDGSPDLYLDLFTASLGLDEGPFWIGRSAGRGRLADKKGMGGTWQTWPFPRPGQDLLTFGDSVALP